MRKTVFGVSIRTLSVSALGIAVLVMLPAFFFMDALYYEVNRANLSQTADTIILLSGNELRHFFERQENIYFDETNIEWFNLIKTETPFRITLITRDGKVIADSHLDPRRMENHRGRQEVDEALLGKKGSARRQSVSIGEQQLYMAVPVWSLQNNLSVQGGESPIGIFRISMNIPSFTGRISSAAAPFLVLVFVVTTGAIFIIFIFSRSLSRAFDRLAAITRAGGSEKKYLFLDEPPLISGTEEFVKVETAMRDMADELHSHIEKAVVEGRRLEAILNGMSEAVFAVDSSLRLILVNMKASLLFGNKENTGLLSASSPTLLEASGSTELEEAAVKVLSQNIPFEFEMKWYRSGKRITFQVYVAPFGIVPETNFSSDASNGVEEKSYAQKGVVIVLNDITRLQKLEQVRKDFAANVSHELRTPLQIVKGFSETILDYLKPETESGKSIPEKTREQLNHFVEIIAKNTKTMENLTGDLLTLVSLENEDAESPEITNVDVDSLMKEAVQSVEIQKEKKKIEIHQSCPLGLMAKLNSLLIIQALTNLLDNAIKYSSAGAGIWFNASVENTPGENGEDEELVFSVKDEGIGIPAEHLERIFERFYRVDKARSREAGGTGLGLAIVRHIALAHNGTAKAESHAGEGSVFTIKIPV